MQISDLNKIQATPSLRGKTEKPAGALVPAPVEIDEDKHDQASVGSIASAVSSSLDASEARVAALRKEYASGSYKVDPTALSSKIIDEELATRD